MHRGGAFDTIIKYKQGVLSLALEHWLAKFAVRNRQVLSDRKEARALG